MSETNEYKVQRKHTWPKGPWDNEPDKLVWKTKAGLPGMIVRNGVGALCGYAAVAKGHPLFEVPYSRGEDYSESPEGRFEVHGGITYSDKCAGHICHVPEPGEPDDVWWFGFDCAHSGDFCPGMHGAFGVLQGRSLESYKDIEYVKAEVEKLAEQLAAVTS